MQAESLSGRGDGWRLRYATRTRRAAEHHLDDPAVAVGADDQQIVPVLDHDFEDGFVGVAVRVT